MTTRQLVPEMQAYTTALASLRRHVLGILEDLDDEQLSRPVLPSGWTCARLLHHLAMDDERFWFRGVVAGDPEIAAFVEGGGGDAWQLPPDLRPRDVLDTYREECARTDAVLAEADPDAPPAWWPSELFGDFRLGSVREIVLHHLSETATHAGHLDAARELLDGRQWMVLPPS